MREGLKVEISLPSVSVIVTAYNEQAFIETTIASILESGFPCELIVVDDGSTDQTPRILEKFGEKIKVITHPTNRGKGAAMASGLKEATGEIVIFCDAHLLGLKQHHLLFMVLPLVYGSAKAVLGVGIQEKIPLPLVDIGPLLVLTGQRAYYRSDLLPLVDEIEDLGYGVETFLLTKFPRNRTAVVLLPGLIHLTKQDMAPLLAVTVGYLREAIEILETLARIQGLAPKELIELRRRLSALLARYMGTDKKRALWPAFAADRPLRWFKRRPFIGFRLRRPHNATREEVHRSFKN
ncbi:MAG: glycosyltransferase family 2 protein [Anaerolineae bacterium]|nr:glycosyltransferase family 2 protein [Anaerolineae bacterium]MDW8101799.1 glycosyltransferase family 2 protein [Anaerolineae bacterium]